MVLYFSTISAFIVEKIAVFSYEKEGFSLIVLCNLKIHLGMNSGHNLLVFPFIEVPYKSNYSPGLQSCM